MDTEEMLDTIDSLIAGFGTRETKDCQNAVFIAKELFNLDLPLEYKGMGRVGVECLRLYCILENGRHLKKNPKVSKIGQTLSQYNSHELMVMASYLWNEGRSSLTEEERQEARALLKVWDENAISQFFKNLESETYKKAVALVVSAREKGNCYDFAEFVLKRLETAHVETELINFYDFRIIPCRNCNYECVQKYDPQKGINAPCPIPDDVQAIWKQAWTSDILLLFVPTYGGLPPALWVAFTQRVQGLSEKPPEDQKQKVVSAVVLASPHWSGPAERTPSVMADEVKLMGRKYVILKQLRRKWQERRKCQEKVGRVETTIGFESVYIHLR